MGAWLSFMRPRKSAPSISLAEAAYCVSCQPPHCDAHADHTHCPTTRPHAGELSEMLIPRLNSTSAIVRASALQALSSVLTHPDVQAAVAKSPGRATCVPVLRIQPGCHVTRIVSCRPCCIQPFKRHTTKIYRHALYVHWRLASYTRAHGPRRHRQRVREPVGRGHGLPAGRQALRGGPGSRRRRAAAHSRPTRPRRHRCCRRSWRRPRRLCAQRLGLHDGPHRRPRGTAPLRRSGPRPGDVRASSCPRADLGL